MRLLFCLIFGVALTSAVFGETWPAISTGSYRGYADVFSISNGEYILANGCESLGGACDLQLSSKGVSFNGFFYAWDAPGLQASRTTKEGLERINIRGKLGEVSVVDLTTEEPKGKMISVIRMTVAPWTQKATQAL